MSDANNPTHVPAAPATLRASDHDRQLVADVLTSAFADGRITRDELDERLADTWRARTFGELTPLTADLQGALAEPSPQYATPTPSAARSAAIVPAVGGAPVRHSAVLGTVRRTGEPLGELTFVKTVLGDVILDLTHSTFAARECRIDVRCVLGDVRLYVPAGVTVLDRTRNVLGDSKARGIEPSPDGPTIVITGAITLGSVTVHGPNDLRTRVKRVWQGS